MRTTLRVLMVCWILIIGAATIEALIYYADIVGIF